MKSITRLITFLTRPAIFSTVFLPMNPVPIIPATLSSNSIHCSPAMVKSASFVIWNDFWIFLDNAKIDETANSAILEGEYAGTLATRIPCSLTFWRGMLSKPAEQQRISWFLFCTKMLTWSSVNFLLTNKQIALYPEASFKTPSGVPLNPDAI